MIRTVEAIIDEHGHVQLLEDVKLPGVRRALVTILEDAPRRDVSETALLSEAALAEDWMRPAVALAGTGREDWTLCRVTSNPYSDVRAILLVAESFRQGGLQRVSYARPEKLFTANRELMTAQVLATCIRRLNAITKVFLKQRPSVITAESAEEQSAVAAGAGGRDGLG